MGLKGCGKDTCANYIVNNYNYKKYAFATPLKKVVKTLFMFNDDQLYKDKKEIIDPRWNFSPRRAFQFIGTDVIRNQIDQDYFVKYFEYWLLNQNQNIVISDVRFVNEAECIKKHGGIIIYVTRHNSNTDNHVSEQEHLNIQYDYIIYNNGSLEDLYYQIDKLFLILKCRFDLVN